MSVNHLGRLAFVSFVRVCIPIVKAKKKKKKLNLGIVTRQSDRLAAAE